VKPGDAWRYARGVARGVRRGDTFPAAGRVPALDAPGGSRRTLRKDGAAELEQVDLSEHDVPLAGLPRLQTVLHVSDVHLRADEEWPTRTLRWIRAAAEAHPPDLLVLTGDVITRGWDEARTRAWMEGLPRPPLGIFAVMGNWEHWGGAPPRRWGGLCADAGITLLRDEAVAMDGYTLVGTEDLLAGPADLDAATRQVDPSRPALVLSHSPAAFPGLVERLRALPGTLTLAGHTHGGQVRLPGLGPLFLPRGSGSYPWGWYGAAPHHLFVHRGMGWSVAPFRWGALPEIATIRLVPA
jgi:predicted MPP superfamily phosphohydrolase